MRIDTWINDELVTIDTDDVWLETFAHWDCLVDTDTAAKIASAVESVLTISARKREITDGERAVKELENLLGDLHADD